MLLARDGRCDGDERGHEREQEDATRTAEAHGAQCRAVPGAYAGTMNTVAPTTTWSKSHSASGMRIRMHPCESE